MTTLSTVRSWWICLLHHRRPRHLRHLHLLPTTATSSTSSAAATTSSTSSAATATSSNASTATATSSTTATSASPPPPLRHRLSATSSATAASSATTFTAPPSPPPPPPCPPPPTFSSFHFAYFTGDASTTCISAEFLGSLVELDIASSEDSPSALAWSEDQSSLCPQAVCAQSYTFCGFAIMGVYYLSGTATFADLNPGFRNIVNTTVQVELPLRRRPRSTSTSRISTPRPTPPPIHLHLLLTTALSPSTFPASPSLGDRRLLNILYRQRQHDVF
ncbi:hypothetical protein CYMTET_49523 [Cymbomonas tetramitiformis]|uniref:Uncharacterized protein n=1 Tax=Cymbomonas tetramitiformis TaxID=36881 RepID=A0AAE0BR92_9CHLO|nr:hypothetical protein CYMTET_49523 [Cymbomonas tetramitiformis]